MLSSKLAAQFLFARLARIANATDPVQWPRVSLHAHMTRDSNEHVTAFSGHFTHAGRPAFPFALCFDTHGGAPVTSMSLMSFSFQEAGVSKTYAALTFIDYLVERGALSREHANLSLARIAGSGTYVNRVAAVNDFSAFCVRAAQVMPHDLARAVIDTLDCPRVQDVAA